MNLLLALLCCDTCGILSHELSTNTSPRIIIVGAGASGIAAASRLLENGFTDITILEAEDRIGGRVHSVKFGDYLLDMGGQWVVEEECNVAFKLAWPLGLLERFGERYNFSLRIFGSSGSALSRETSLEFANFFDTLRNDINKDEIEKLETGSFGEYADPLLYRFLKSQREIKPEMYQPLRYMANLIKVSDDASNSWYDLSAKGLYDYPSCEGGDNINWKNRTYATILDILMKKIPNPEEELPVLEKTHKNTKVVKINYNKDYDEIKVSTADGEEYSADHVIFTPSLGVLKANYQRLFSPPLPEKKVKAIKNIGYGNEGKIYLYYDDPWWNIYEDEYMIKSIYWTKADKEELENDPERTWMLGLINLIPVEHKPKVACFWVASEHAIEMELVPEDVFRRQITGVIKKFFGNYYNITEPTKILRSSWNTNENFLGTYSYRGLESDSADVSYEDLAEPIERNDKPILQFAGEATQQRYGLVNGAIESGWREADRLITLYGRENDQMRIVKQLAQKVAGRNLNLE